MRSFFNSIKRFRNERGMSLVEIILVIVIMGIAMAPISQLAVSNLKSGGRHTTMTRAMYYAQEVMEQVIADYAAEDGGRGYDWVLANWQSQSAPGPPTGLSSLVTLSAQDTLDGVVYVEVQVAVSGTDIGNVQLSTWIVETN